MGREVRRVAPGWNHPRRRRPDGTYEFTPLRPFSHLAEESTEWREMSEDEREQCPWGPPTPYEYMPDWDESDVTWWQVYENVSEGTPVSPPFATKEELRDWLVTDNHWSLMRLTPEDVDIFLDGGWMPTFALIDNSLSNGLLPASPLASPPS